MCFGHPPNQVAEPFETGTNPDIAQLFSGMTGLLETTELGDSSTLDLALSNALPPDKFDAEFAGKAVAEAGPKAAALLEVSSGRCVLCETSTRLPGIQFRYYRISKHHPQSNNQTLIQSEHCTNTVRSRHVLV